jgi:hypothetical protein
MKKPFLMILIFILFVSKGDAQLTNAPSLNFAVLGESVDGIRLSICCSNSVVFTNSELVVNLRMENTSTNVLRMGGSAPEADFDVWLKSEDGKEYQLTKNWHSGSSKQDQLVPGAHEEWVLHLEVDKYYFPLQAVISEALSKKDGTNKVVALSGDAFRSKTGVPPGDYALDVTRRLLLPGRSLPETIHANLLKITIK